MALQYWLVMTRRDQSEERNKWLEAQTFNLNPRRWGDVYRQRVLGEMANLHPDVESGDGSDFSGVLTENDEVPITDPDLLEQWFEQMSQTHSMTGAEDRTPGIGGTIRGEWV